MPEEEGKKTTIFGYPLKDWVILFAILTGGTSTLAYTGLPGNRKEDAVGQKTVNMLEDIQDSIDLTARTSQRNSARIDALEDSRNDFREDISAELDTLQHTLVLGLANLDGYFKGRLDQISGDGR